MRETERGLLVNQKTGRRRWIKLHVSMLRGSTFQELEPDERWVWIGFLLLAGDCCLDGKIGLTEKMGFTDEQIAELLKCSLELLERAKEKMIRFGKILVHPVNVIEILNWKKYQSEYLRQKQYRKSYKQKLHPKVTKESYQQSNTVEIEKEKEKEIEKEYLKDLSNSEHASAKEKQYIRKEKKDWDLELIIDKWNDFANRHGLPKIQGIVKGSTRERHLRARLNDKNFSFDSLLRTIEASPFLLGQKTDFKATFDWIMLPGNYQKIIEGNYFESIYPPKESRASKIGESKEKINYPPTYWDKVRELKEKGLEGQSLTRELQKIPEFQSFFKKQEELVDE